MTLLRKEMNGPRKVPASQSELAQPQEDLAHWDSVLYNSCPAHTRGGWLVSSPRSRVHADLDPRPALSPHTAGRGDAGLKMESILHLWGTAGNGDQAEYHPLSMSTARGTGVLGTYAPFSAR